MSKTSVHIDPNNVGLDRADELAIINNANGPKLYRMRRKIIATFKIKGLSITAETNLVETDFLDVLFNLSIGKHYLYNKLNNVPFYIHAKYNHPSSIVNHLQKWLIKESQIYPVMKPHLIMQN